MNNAFATNSRFFSQKNAPIKKEVFDHKVFKLQRFNKVLPNVGGIAQFWRGH